MFKTTVRVAACCIIRPVSSQSVSGEGIWCGEVSVIAWDVTVSLGE